MKFTIFPFLLCFTVLCPTLVLANAAIPIAQLKQTEINLPDDSRKMLPGAPNFDIRIRPLGLLSTIWGVETNIIIGPRFEIGPAVHYFTGQNDVRGSAVKTWEFGIKASYLVYLAAYHEGAYLSIAGYEYLTQVSQSSPTGFSGSTDHFFTPGGTFTAGYQWQLGLFRTDAVTLRLGGGLGYKREHVEFFNRGQNFIGVQRRLDPTTELTLGVSL